MEGPAQARYDLFVSYAEPDRAWVEGYLLDALSAAGACILSEQSFRLGVPRLLEFERAVRQSVRVLLVLSPAYVAEESAQFVDLLAQSYGLETSTWPVIPLIYKPCTLPPRLAVLTALDAIDETTWPGVVARLCAELERPVPEAAPRPACPYRGLQPFGEADSPRFFGRDIEVEAMLAALHKHPFLAVIGPSGSGKSSAVFAGLIPALRRSQLFGPGEWTVRTVRPGADPMAALRSGVGDLLDLSAASPSFFRPSAVHLLLVVDQLEELFAGGAKGQAEPFSGALLRLACLPGCYVVITVRADFYPELMASDCLWPEVDAHRLEVLRLGEEGLRQAVVRPAEGAGVYVDAALVERLVADAGGEPGILPFLQETLVLLWEKVERRYLPLRAYEALVLPRAAYGGPPVSGLQRAMTLHADAVLGPLSPAEKVLARRTFLRLVQFVEGRGDMRRQQPVEALRAAGDEPWALDRTLEHLARGRLLTLSGEGVGEGQRADAARHVDIAHEALIRGWPLLQGWISERREAELVRRRLEDKAAEWVRLGRGKGGLLDKVVLREAAAWMDSQAAADLGRSDELIALRDASHAALRTQRLLQWLAVASASIVVLALVVLIARAGYKEWVRRTVGTKLVTIDGGPAVIGTDDRTVTLSPFRIERYEVSVAQYRACIHAGVCDKPEVPDWAGTDESWYENESWDDLPIVEVTARQAHDYCTWLGRRLPTAVEWERAARGPGPEGRVWPWGKDEKPAAGCDSEIKVVPVDSHEETATAPPEEGIYHLADNVSEWVALVLPDCERDSCHQAWDPNSRSPVALIGGSCERHIDRVAELKEAGPDSPGMTRGFRCAADGLP